MTVLKCIRLHQGSVLGSLLFNLYNSNVFVSQEIRGELPWKLLVYADNLVLMAESESEFIAKTGEMEI